jgi:hypothetical protein
MDSQRQAAREQTYQELLEIVARLDALRRYGSYGLEPLANSAMHAASHAAWSLWRGLRPHGVTQPVFADLGDRRLELAREWSAAGRPAPDDVAAAAQRVAVRQACEACDPNGWVNDPDDDVDKPLRRCAHPGLVPARTETKARVSVGESILDP